MKVFSISDLHMDSSDEKPMSVFGGNWTNHMEKIKADWVDKVAENDLVLIGGDISWAMETDAALKDIESLSGLPGKKILIKGNHDYWWHSITRLREKLPPDFFALQNDAVRIENVVVCGSRGWSVDGCPDFGEADKKICLREAERLKLSFMQAEKLREEGDRLVCLMHYPPFNVRREDSPFTAVIERYGADAVSYGHLHGKDARADFLVEKNGVKYYLTSFDLMGNKLTQIL